MMITQIIENAEKQLELEPQECLEERKSGSRDPIQAVIEGHLKIRNFLARIEGFILDKKRSFKNEGESLVQEFQAKVQMVIDV